MLWFHQPDKWGRAGEVLGKWTQFLENKVYILTSCPKELDGLIPISTLKSNNLWLIINFLSSLVLYLNYLTPDNTLTYLSFGFLCEYQSAMIILWVCREHVWPLTWWLYTSDTIFKYSTIFWPKINLKE